MVEQEYREDFKFIRVIRRQVINAARKGANKEVADCCASTKVNVQHVCGTRERRNRGGGGRGTIRMCMDVVGGWREYVDTWMGVVGDSGRREGVGRRMCGCDSIIVA